MKRQSSIITAERHHDIACGHRVVGHESKCAHFHGHGYRFTFTVKGPKDAVGRVLDFSHMKSKLCVWLEENYDHKTLVWDQDPIYHDMAYVGNNPSNRALFINSFVTVPYNPTAENIADHLLQIVGPKQLQGTGVKLISVRVQETYKCSATAELSM